MNSYLSRSLSFHHFTSNDLALLSFWSQLIYLKIFQYNEVVFCKLSVGLWCILWQKLWKLPYEISIVPLYMCMSSIFSKQSYWCHWFWVEKSFISPNMLWTMKQSWKVNNCDNIHLIFTSIQTVARNYQPLPKCKENLPSSISHRRSIACNVCQRGVRIVALSSILNV